MNNRIIHVGVDVDDSSFHLGAFCRETGEVFEMRCKPNLGSLMKKLKKLEKRIRSMNLRDFL